MTLSTHNWLAAAEIGYAGGGRTIHSVTVNRLMDQARLEGRAYAAIEVAKLERLLVCAIRLLPDARVTDELRAAYLQEPKSDRPAPPRAERESGEPERFENLNQVMARTGMGRSWIYREIAAGAFPSPVKIGVRDGRIKASAGASRWNARDIDAWIRQQTTQSATRG